MLYASCKVHSACPIVGHAYFSTDLVAFKAIHIVLKCDKARACVCTCVYMCRNECGNDSLYPAGNISACHSLCKVSLGQGFFTLSLFLSVCFPLSVGEELWSVILKSTQVRVLLKECAPSECAKDRGKGGATLLPHKARKRKEGCWLTATHLNNLSKRGGTRHTFTLKHESYVGGIFSPFCTAGKEGDFFIFLQAIKVCPWLGFVKTQVENRFCSPSRLIIGQGEN